MNQPAIVHGYVPSVPLSPLIIFSFLFLSLSHSFDTLLRQLGQVQWSSEISRHVMRCRRNFSSSRMAVAQRGHMLLIPSSEMLERFEELGDSDSADRRRGDSDSPDNRRGDSGGAGPAEAAARLAVAAGQARTWALSALRSTYSRPQCRHFGPTD
jgi:hypothetical protein